MTVAEPDDALSEHWYHLSDLCHFYVECWEDEPEKYAPLIDSTGRAEQVAAYYRDLLAGVVMITPQI